jgi:aspartyl-tRNA(Asn)/glutamyl-tRNA(Gln) amidotransferase subunit A
MRVGVLAPHRALAEELDPGVAAAFDAAVATLRDLGAQVRELDLPEEPRALAAGLIILFAEATAVHRRRLRERPGAFGPDVRARLEAGALIPAADYVDAQRARAALVAQILERFAAVDVVVGPAVPIGAPPIETTAIRMGGRDVDPRTVLLRLTRLADVTGQPAVSTPCGFTAEALPVGLQVPAQPVQVSRAVLVAQFLPQATVWQLRRPALD